MRGRSWQWKVLAYAVLTAVANALFADKLDGSEVAEVIFFFICATVGEGFFEWRGRYSRKHAVATKTRSEPCEGPHSVTTWNCNGSPAEVDTCSEVGTSLEDHLEDHHNDVVAKATELGCA